MGTHLSKTVFRQFLTTGKSMIAGQTNCVVCSNKKITFPVIDTDGFHRCFRIMAKHGLMEAEEKSDGTYYTITPKGVAVIDFFMLSSKPL